MLSEKSEINRVIRRGGKTDGLMSRASLNGLLDSTALRPPGLPRDAVLISKTIRCAVKQTRLRGSREQLQLSEWQAGIDDALAASCQRAVRYVNGRCESNAADSVIFDTVPEALACFLCDIARGSVHGEWWWTSYLRKYPVGSDRFAAIASIIDDNLIFLPRIVRCLAEWKMLTVVFGGISDIRCSEIIGNFQACFRMDLTRNSERLNELVCLLSGFNDTSEQNRKIEFSAEEFVDDTLKRKEGSNRFDRQITFHSIAAQYSQPIESPDSRNLGSLSWINQPDAIGLFGALYSATRHNSYKNFFHGLWQEIIGGALVPTELSFAQCNLAGLAYLVDRNLNAVRSSEFQNVFSVLSDRMLKSRFHEVRRAVREKAILPAVIADRLPEYKNSKTNYPFFKLPANKPIVSRPTVDPLNKKNVSVNNMEGPGPENEYSVSESSGQSFPIQAFSSPFDLSREWQWTTDYGGVLYLFNLLRFLDIPDVFADSGNIHNTLSPWAWLEILARYLLANEYHKEDDLWKALALLDDRDENTMLGGDVRINAELCVPKMWLDYLACPDADQSGCVESAAVISAAFDGVITSSSLLSVLGVLLPVIECCLIRATGEKSESIVNALLRCRGHISITRTHVDFYTSLDNISLAARRAGLDRDPGWCPEVGKVVQFHFE